jgi:hypothetical protein
MLLTGSAEHKAKDNINYQRGGNGNSSAISNYFSIRSQHGGNRMGGGFGFATAGSGQRRARNTEINSLSQNNILTAPELYNT